jgi:hypothetical protein
MRNLKVGVAVLAAIWHKYLLFLNNLREFQNLAIAKHTFSFALKKKQLQI